jgi:hypothetical protein
MPLKREDKPPKSTSESPRRQKSRTKEAPRRQGSKRISSTSDITDDDSKSTRKGRRKSTKSEKDDEREEQERGVQNEEFNKSFIDQFLDHDVVGHDSASERGSPYGTRKSKISSLRDYKAGLKKGFREDHVNRAGALRKMQSVPSIGSRSGDLVEVIDVIVTDNDDPADKPGSAKSKKSKKLAKTKKRSSKNKDKDEPYNSKDKDEPKKEEIEIPKEALREGLPHVTLNDLPRQSALKIDEERHKVLDRKGPTEKSGHLKKSMSLSNLDKISYDLADKALLVTRLKTLSNSKDEADHDDKVSLKTKEKDKSDGQSTSTAGKKSRTKKQKTTSSSKGRDPSTSVRNITDSKPGVPTAGRWSSVPHGLGTEESTTETPKSAKKGKVMSSPTKKSKKSGKKKGLKDHDDDEDNDNEIIDIISPPRVPVRKLSRQPREWQSTPNFSNDRGNNVAKPVSQRSSLGHDIAEGVILEVPDDISVCSELTDIHSIDIAEASPRKPKRNNKLSSISEIGASAADDDLTKDSSLHRSRRWESKRNDASAIDSLKSPMRPVESLKDEKKKRGWIRRFPFMK